jgi:L-ascorbate metabolism protein UlaG (beta-lactamase superfamily)
VLPAAIGAGARELGLICPGPQGPEAAWAGTVEVLAPADLPARFGPLRAAILPVGAYEPRWFMKDQHQNPEEAIEGFLLSGADHALGHHWGTFQLTDEPREEPPRLLAAAARAMGFAPDRFVAGEPGDAYDIRRSSPRGA